MAEVVELRRPTRTADEPDIEGLVLLHEDVTIESAAFIAAIRTELADPDVAVVGAVTLAAAALAVVFDLHEWISGSTRRLEWLQVDELPVVLLVAGLLIARRIVKSPFGWHVVATVAIPTVASTEPTNGCRGPSVRR